MARRRGRCRTLASCMDTASTISTATRGSSSIWLRTRTRTRRARREWSLRRAWQPGVGHASRDRGGVADGIGEGDCGRGAVGARRVACRGVCAGRADCGIGALACGWRAGQSGRVADDHGKASCAGSLEAGCVARPQARGVGTRHGCARGARHAGFRGCAGRRA
ncbi:RNA polymerase sigma-70 factor, ECF subfamily [Caballeronia sordidicola]|uniref:RNA polymerase sigma-70 factor, ECF subfamily n=1 Tax=Caballeronia sordidicola TaxID=196367 RepID=A0A226WWG0_CABSO|nr:RNA polymerase sigma-70 factor, ECF subfamily [Caballeronia sordidicola]